MKEWSFTVPGPLQGSRDSIGSWRRKDGGSKGYTAYKHAIRLLANVAGVPDEATETTSIEVEIRWRLGARWDGIKILRAIEDALFRHDRRCSGGKWTREMFTGIEAAVVTVREG